MKKARKSMTYSNTKSNTKRRQGFRASVCPPIQIGGTTRRPRAAHEKRSQELEPGVRITVVLPYPPVSGNHAARHAGGRHYRTEAAQRYRTQVGAELLAAGLAGPRWAPLTNLRVRVQLCPPDGRVRDHDNAIKEIADAITKVGFWLDDSNRVIHSWQIDWLPALTGGAVRVTVELWQP